MTKEALKLALEALENLFGIPDKWTGEGGGDVAVWRLGGSYRAQQAITAIKEALAEPEKDNTYVYASSLATAIWHKHYMKDSPKWKPLDTTEGVLTQIDNMTCGLVKEKTVQPEQEPVAWEGGEGWESLAWELCADENGEDSCNELIWEGGPIPEPWGDHWMKYEEEAKRLIALVQKHTTPPQRKPLSEEEIGAILEDVNAYGTRLYTFARAIEAAHGIKGEA